MKIKSRYYILIIALGALLLSSPSLGRTQTSNPNKNPLSIEKEVADIYTRYSRHLDNVWRGAGWDYSVPSRHYRETNENSVNNLRLQATLAATYRFRDDAAAAEKVRTAVLNVLGPKARLVTAVTEKGRTVSTRSFQDMIGLYLALRILRTHENFFSPAERDAVVKNVRLVFPWALRGPDNENRALLAAAYGLAVVRHGLAGFSETERRVYEKKIRQKVAVGLRAVDRAGVYHEGKDKKYSLHYHLVSALALSFLGEQMPDKQYKALSQKMLQRIRAWYKLGKLHWAGSGRPTGLGLQTVLLRALGEKYLGNKNWQKYWEVEKNGRGFIDPKNKNRLVWRDDIDKTLNDDYSFLNMAELFWDKLR